MTAVTPVDYGYAVQNTVPVVPQNSPDAWLMVDDVQQILEAGAERYAQQEAEAELSFENQRYQEQLDWQRQQDYVRTQQDMRQYIPNFTDPELIQQQIEWLVQSM